MTAPTRRLRIAPQEEPRSDTRVLFLIDSLGPGGAERLMVDLLPRLRQHRVVPTVVAIQERHGNLVADSLRGAGVTVDTIGIQRLRERGALARVTQAIESAMPDVVHTQLEFSSILGSIAAHRLGIPSISTIHTLDRPRRFSRDSARFRIMAWTLRHRAQRVIAVSESARTHVLARAGLHKSKTMTIHNGIDLTEFARERPSARSEVRKQLGIARDAVVVATVAVLRQAKGIDDMLDALPFLLRRHPDLTYLIVGDGPHRSALEEHVAERGIAGSVRFAGTRSDVATMLAASDVFVHPSHAEALPTVVIEAMTAGLPVIATNVGGTPEIIESGATGILVPPHSSRLLADALERILESPRQARAMANAARRTAIDRFDIDRQVARLADEYRVLVARREAR